LIIAEKDAEIARRRARGEGDAIRIRCEGEAEGFRIRAQGKVKAQQIIARTLTPEYLRFKLCTVRTPSSSCCLISSRFPFSSIRSRSIPASRSNHDRGCQACTLTNPV
jgi:hypothetical protein